MSDSVLDRYTSKINGNATEQPDNDVADIPGAFGWLRGIRDRAIMLELRHKDGKVSAFGYAWLENAEFDPSNGITLHFAGKPPVRITGRNLNAESRPQQRLFNGIVRHRVPWIQEADEPTALEAPKDATVIEGLEIR